MKYLTPEEQRTLSESIQRTLLLSREELEQALKEGAPKQISDSAHTLASAAGNGGHDQVMQLARTIEELVEQNRVEEIPPHFKRLQPLLSAILE